MKLYGKKLLAMILALSMVMSVCVFAEGEGEGGTETPVAVTSVTLNKSTATVAKGDTVTLTAVVAPDDAADKTVDWSTSDDKIATVADGVVTAVGGGTATITASAGGKNATCKITVTGDTVTAVTPAAVEVAYGTTEAKAIEALGNKEMDVTYASGGTGKEKVTGWTDKGDKYDATVPGDYTFENATYGVETKVTVKKASLKSGTTVGTIAFPVGTDVDDIEDEIEDLFEEIDLEYNELEDEIEVTIGSASSDDYDGWTAPASFDEDDVGTYTFTATANTDSDYYAYCEMPKLSLTVMIYSDEFEMEVERGGKSLSTIATEINNILLAMFGEGAETIYITDLDLEGGTLYTSSTCAEELDADELTKSEFAALYYVPNGSGEDSVIEFEAYYDEDQDEDALEGTITLLADPYMMISIEVTEDDVIELDADEFEEQFLNQNKDYEELAYVTFSHTNGKTKGYLYYDYDKDENKGTAVKTAKCYVDPDDGQIDLNDVVYVPGADMKEGTYTISFTAKGYKKNSSSLKTETGTIVITFVETADITIQAGVGETVEVDADLFQDYLEDKVSSTKSLNIVSVSITNPPRSENAGYLYTDGTKLSKSGAKTFYADPDDDEYALDDIEFKGGKKAMTTTSTFKITYTVGTSSTKKTLEGDIDFIVGVSTVIATKEPIAAAQVLKFSGSIDAFETVGGQENEYFKFTSLPKGAKLYYNYGLSSQEDVTVGTAYYLSGTGKKLLKNITFVPSYSATKKQQVITFEFKAYDDDDKAVNGTCQFEVKYASKSAYFSDITTSTYADSVDFLRNQGITTGVPGGLYDAAGSLTRAQVVTFLYRAAGSPAVSGTTTFKDIVKGEYYYNAVLWASQTGVTSGRSATVFDPNATVTNAEVIQFMYNFDVKYLKHTAYTNGSSSVVTDYAKVESWAQTAVKWAIGKEVLTSGYLYPANVGTRGNIALYLHRMLTL